MYACCCGGCHVLRRLDGAFAKKMHPVEVIVEVITVWWQYIIIVALLALGIYGFVVLVRTMTRQLTRKTDRRAEDMYDEFDSARKEKDRWPV
jgi:flagellar biosynthesis/type III secretory pathway M-ring protein FliF/YscJ